MKLSAIARARVRAFYAGIKSGDFDRGQLVAVEPFTVDLDGTPRTVVALSTRVEGDVEVLSFHVVEVVRTATIMATVGGGGL